MGSYLHILELEKESASPEYLANLHRQHLNKIPFQNVNMLISEHPEELRPSVLARACWTGRGGTCYQLATGFTSLLQSLGFDAKLVASTVRHKHDHMVTAVDFGDHRYVSDVGNGHPYPNPWKFDPSKQEFGGFRFRMEDGKGVVEHGPSWRKNQEIDTIPTSVERLSDSINRHHLLNGYGPFRDGLRIIKGQQSVRDQAFIENGQLTPITNLDSLLKIGASMGIAKKDLRGAVEVLARRNPDKWIGPNWVESTKQLELDNA